MASTTLSLPPKPAVERSARIGADRLFIALALIGGLAIRLIWLQRVHGRVVDFLSAAEASNVALSVATHGTIADAYFPGQGATAHLMPLNPMIAGMFMWLWGPGTMGADVSLLAWSLAQTACGYLFVAKLFRRLGADAATLRWGIALLMLAVPFVPQETVDFRYWEGGSALCLGTLNLLLIVKLDATSVISRRTVATIALLSAVTFFVCPPVGLAADCCWAAVALRRLPFRQCLSIAATSAAAVVLMVTPWALRNASALGSLIPLRSNAGLELAIGNYPGALDEQPDPAHAFAARLGAIHPAANRVLRPLVAQHGGEVAYSARLGATARHWIAHHPTQAARLWGRHLRRFFFPEAWQFYFSGWEGMRIARATTVSLVALLGLAGLAFGVLERRRGVDILAIYIAAIALPYALVPPMPRYIFLTYPLFVFLAVGAVRRAFSACGGAAWAR